MIKLSPAEMAMVKAWYEYLHSHKPNIHHEHEEDNDIIRRSLLVYLMMEIMYDYYQALDVHWPSYTMHRMVQVVSTIKGAARHHLAIINKIVLPLINKQ